MTQTGAEQSIATGAINTAACFFRRFFGTFPGSFLVNLACSCGGWQGRWCQTANRWRDA